MRPEPRPAAPARPVGARSFVIVSTAYVVPPPRQHRAPHYEIVAAYDQERDSTRYSFVTRDQVLIDRAIAAEGSDERFTLTWRGTVAGIRCNYLALVTLEPVHFPESCHA